PTGPSRRTCSSPASGRPPCHMKFSLMASNQSTRARVSSSCPKCLVRSPTPWPMKRAENAITKRRGPAPGGTGPPCSSFLFRRDYRAALGLAVLRVLGLVPALALAAVLSLAGVVAAGAGAPAPAVVDAGALDRLGRAPLRLALVLPRMRRTGCEHGGDRRRDDCALEHFLQHGSLLFMSCTGPPLIGTAFYPRPKAQFTRPIRSSR